jgi:hypothetical protein
MSKLSGLAKQQKTTVRQLITVAIRKEGSIFRAALSLGVTPNSIQYWLRRNGYEVKRTPTLVKQAANAKQQSRNA